MSAEEFLKSIRDSASKISRKIRLMEVCGTHTVSIFRAGIRQLLPKNIELVSGPGCPVCVTSDDFLDKAIEYSKNPNIIIATFGDMLRVPGSKSTLRESTGDIRAIYSPLDSIRIAQENPLKTVIFLAVGFETTAPTAAATILESDRLKLENLKFLSAQKLVPPALKILLSDPATQIDGLLLPGHVAVVTGVKAFEFLQIPSVVAGFKPDEILRAIDWLLIRIAENRSEVGNCYESVVHRDGNPQAQKILDSVYEVADSNWRGLGLIPKSGLKIRQEFERFDVEKIIPIQIPESRPNPNCRCGEVLRGSIVPTECKLFGKICKPEHATGPCMASVEGTCSAWFRYGGSHFEF